MSGPLNRWLTAMVGVLASAAGAAPTAPASYREGALAAFTTTADSRLWVEGTSSFRPYRAEALDVYGSLVLDVDAGTAVGAGLQAALCLGGARQLDLRVSVQRLRSGIGVQDQHLAQALKGQAHPWVRFQVDAYDAIPAATGAAAGCGLRLRGSLFIAGVERKVEVRAEVTRDSTGVRIAGSKELRMSDYGVKVPDLMFGRIKTDDRMVVKFNLGLDRT